MYEVDLHIFTIKVKLTMLQFYRNKYYEVGEPLGNKQTRTAQFPSSFSRIVNMRALLLHEENKTFRQLDLKCSEREKAGHIFSFEKNIDKICK